MSENTGNDAPAPLSPGEPTLRAEGVTAGYGGAPIIEDVSLAVPAGKITAIVGPNGAGKSTLLKALYAIQIYPPGLSFAQSAARIGAGSAICSTT
jgi:ABC-type Mn2+/Zn2+ transport system ATPase subunit